MKICDLITESVNLKCSHYLVMGDFNYPRIDWNSWSLHSENVETFDFQLIQCFQDNCLYQQVERPTQWRGTDKQTFGI